MSAGTLQSILICVPVSSNQASTVDQQVCPPAGGVFFHLQQQQAYVLAPESAGYIDSITTPFDYTTAARFWGVAFTTIITLWFVSHGAGVVVNFLRRV